MVAISSLSLLLLLLLLLVVVVVLDVVVANKRGKEWCPRCCDDDMAPWCNRPVLHDDDELRLMLLAAAVG